MDKYKELKAIADRLEDLRVELFNSPEHKNNVDKELFEEIDDTLFRVQSEIRNIYNICDEDAI